jgi:hypothetical protein
MILERFVQYLPETLQDLWERGTSVAGRAIVA